MGIVMKDSLWKEKGIATDMRDQCSHKLYNSILYCVFFYWKLYRNFPTDSYLVTLVQKAQNHKLSLYYSIIYFIS